MLFFGQSSRKGIDFSISKRVHSGFGGRVMRERTPEEKKEYEKWIEQMVASGVLSRV
jgi:hypothetical protein